MRSIIVLLFFVSVAVAQPSKSKWEQEPTSFRNVPFGASKEEAKKITDFDDCHDKEDFEDKSLTPPFCASEFNFGDVPVVAYFVFPDGKFSYVYISFNSDSYETMRETFVAKYGMPGKTKYKENEIAAKLNQFLQWEGESAFVELRRYTSNFGEGMATIGLKAALEARRKQRVEKAKSR